MRRTDGQTGEGTFGRADDRMAERADPWTDERAYKLIDAGGNNHRRDIQVECNFKKNV